MYKLQLNDKHRLKLICLLTRSLRLKVRQLQKCVCASCKVQQLLSTDLEYQYSPKTCSVSFLSVTTLLGTALLIVILQGKGAQAMKENKHEDTPDV